MFDVRTTGDEALIRLRLAPSDARYAGNLVAGSKALEIFADLETGGHRSIAKVPAGVIRIVDIKCPGSLEAAKTDWICPSLALGMARIHCRPSFSGSAWKAKSACKALRSVAEVKMAAGVEPNTCACLRAVTWFRSTSYIHSVWPSATKVCAKGLEY